MTIQVDTREKLEATRLITATFDRRGVQYFRSKLFVGDYASLDKPRLVIDRKQTLLELATNVTTDRQRFTDELKRAQQFGIRVVILCEHGEGILTLEDVRGWVNPRLKESPMAISGPRLYTVLSTLSNHYGADFMFCDKAQTGAAILALLA